MKFNRKTVSTVLLASTILMTVGCSKDEETPIPTPAPTPTPTPSYVVPTTFAFVDANGASTVSFSRQFSQHF